MFDFTLGSLGLTEQEKKDLAEYERLKRRADGGMTEKQKAEARKKEQMPGKGPGPKAPYTGAHATYYMAPPETQQFDVADWSLFYPQQEQRAAQQVYSPVPSGSTTVLRMGPGNRTEQRVHVARETEIGAPVMDLYGEMAWRDLSRNASRLTQGSDSFYPAVSAEAPTVAAQQMPTLSPQHPASEYALESAEAPSAPIMSAAVAAPQEESGFSMWWVVAAVGVAALLARKGGAA